MKQPTRRQLLNLGLAGIAGAALAGCASGGSLPKVTLALSTLSNPFFADLRDGAAATAREVGIDLAVVNAQDNAESQLDQMRTAAVSGSRAVIVNPVDSDAAKPAATAVMEQGIPLIAVDRGITDRTPDSFIASDNVAGGRQAATLLAGLLHSRGKIAVLEGQPGASATRDRGEGFLQELRKYPEMQVVTSQTANFDREEALDVMTNMMQAVPDIDAVYAHNDEMALGAAVALGSRAGTDVKIIGFDGGGDALEAVRVGTLSGTIAQSPAELGRQAVLQAVRVIHGEPPQASVPVPVTTVTKDNVDEFQNKAEES
ncbi:substrate-binding domain-containing protein [Kocuria sp.]|uniref:substrate-binding domain-containing protein n=1 Tax=Kocuria sp. TaxID=1871328 RepID=UPI00289822AD|nr:substrate-binding domain-containing protein [Kocuria sp.]